MKGTPVDAASQPFGRTKPLRVLEKRSMLASTGPTKVRPIGRSRTSSSKGLLMTSKKMRIAAAVVIATTVALGPPHAASAAPEGLLVNTSTRATPQGCPDGAIRNFTVVAHHDDDVLFLNPDIDDAIRAGECVQTVFLVASDYKDAARETYMLAREEGIRSAYGNSAGTTNWLSNRMTIGDKEVETWTAGDKVSIIELRLPDNGSSYTRSDGQTVRPGSLSSLYSGAIPKISDFYGWNTWTKGELTEFIAAAIRQFAGTGQLILRGMDPSADLHHGDDYYDFHHDHVVAAKVLDDAALIVGHAGVIHYRDYVNRYAAQNLTATQLHQKQLTFGMFAAHDMDIGCTVDSSGACITSVPFYAALNHMQYTAGPVSMLPWVPASPATGPGHAISATLDHVRLRVTGSDLCLTAVGAHVREDLADGHPLVLKPCNSASTIGTGPAPGSDLNTFTLVDGYLKVDLINECVSGEVLLVVNQCGRDEARWTFAADAHFVTEDGRSMVAEYAPNLIDSPIAATAVGASGDRLSFEVIPAP